MIISGVAMITAAFLLWRRDLDRAFAVAAFGLVAWFLNYRMQMKEVAARADVERVIQAENHEEDKDQDTV